MSRLSGFCQGNVKDRDPHERPVFIGLSWMSRMSTFLAGGGGGGRILDCGIGAFGLKGRHPSAPGKASLRATPRNPVPDDLRPGQTRYLLCRGSAGAGTVPRFVPDLLRGEKLSLPRSAETDVGDFRRFDGQFKTRHRVRRRGSRGGSGDRCGIHQVAAVVESFESCRTTG
jgi:hypothetical protein